MGFGRAVPRRATMRLGDVNLDQPEFATPEPTREPTPGPTDGAAPIGASGAPHPRFEREDVDAVRSGLEAEGFAFDGPTRRAEPDHDGRPNMTPAHLAGPGGEHLEPIRPTGPFPCRAAEA